MSYRFRLILLYFDACGTTASYFGGSCRTVGTIIGRTRKDGSKAFTAQIVVKKGGAIVHREAETFDRKQASQRLDRQAGGWARRQGHSQAWYPYVWAWGWACRSAGRSLKRMAGARGPVRTCPGAPPSNLLCLPDRTFTSWLDSFGSAACLVGWTPLLAVDCWPGTRARGGTASPRKTRAAAELRLTRVFATQNVGSVLSTGTRADILW